MHPKKHKMFVNVDVNFCLFLVSVEDLQHLSDEVEAILSRYFIMCILNKCTAMYLHPLPVSTFFHFLMFWEYNEIKKT